MTKPAKPAMCRHRSQLKPYSTSIYTGARGEVCLCCRNCGALWRSCRWTKPKIQRQPSAYKRWLKQDEARRKLAARGEDASE